MSTYFEQIMQRESSVGYLFVCFAIFLTPVRIFEFMNARGPFNTYQHQFFIFVFAFALVFFLVFFFFVFSQLVYQNIIIEIINHNHGQFCGLAWGVMMQTRSTFLCRGGFLAATDWEWIKCLWRTCYGI